MKFSPNIAVIYIFIVCQLLHDKLVRMYPNEININVNIFYFVHVYGFVAYFIFQEIKKLKKNPYSKDIVILKGVFIINIAYILLFLVCIGQDLETYNNTVNNYIIDYVKYASIIIIFLVVLWQKYLSSSRL